MSGSEVRMLDSDLSEFVHPFAPLSGFTFAAMVIWVHASMKERTNSYAIEF